MTVIVDREHQARRADQLEREAERQQFLEAEAQAVAGAPVASTRIRADGGRDDLPKCPMCGEPVKAMSVFDPNKAYLMPCGHSVPPDSVGYDEEGER